MGAEMEMTDDSMDMMDGSMEICTEENVPEWHVGCEFPSFDIIDQNGTHWNGSSANETGRWVAYFSASWCTHCKPTIDALDQSMMERSFTRVQQARWE